MAAGTFTLYRANLDDLRMQDLVGATVKVALVSSAYTPDAANTGHDEWADVSANEIANGNGYTTGGATLANDAVSTITNGHKYDSDDPAWTARRQHPRLALCRDVRLRLAVGQDQPCHRLLPGRLHPRRCARHHGRKPAHHPGQRQRLVRRDAGVRSHPC